MSDLDLGVEDPAPFLNRLGHLARQLHLSSAYTTPIPALTHTLY
jgi:hypothetical protein